VDHGVDANCGAVGEIPDLIRRDAVALSIGFDAERLRRLARQTKDAAQVRRLLTLASIYDGGTRLDTARLGNVTLQIVRDWVMRFNERGPQGLGNGKAPGQPRRLNNQQRAALAQAIGRGPTPSKAFSLRASEFSMPPNFALYL
jgi:hypothetical protein